jgi:hypothetical protein
MSWALRRILDLGPNATIWPGSPGDLRFHDNRQILRDTRSSWVRIWADWPRLQPDPLLAIDDPASPGLPFLQVLDEQIAIANAEGVRVLLVVHRIAPWANGTAGLVPLKGTDAEISFQYWDRIAQRAWERYVLEGRDPRRYTPSRRALEYRTPDEGFGPGTAWARWFAALYERFHLGRRGAGPHVHGFELVNEPNWLTWPQRRPPAEGQDPYAPTALEAPARTAEMSVTARAVAAERGDTSLVLHGSMADAGGEGRRVTAWDEFLPALLDEQQARGFAATARDVFAHHSYTDVERRSTDTRVQRVRDVLRGRWTGYAEGEGPTVFITESGVRVSRMREYYPDEDPLQAQAATMRLALERFGGESGPGAGIGMLAQYQTYADPRFDTGLLEPWPSTTRRPVFDVWAGAPSR